jgi:hypothetical protein
MSTPKNLNELNRAIRRDNARFLLKWVAGIAALCLLYSGYETVTTPTSYADCVLSEIPGVQNDVAAAAVAQSCTQRFGSYQIRVPLPWYRLAHGRYRDVNERAIRETSGISDAPRIFDGMTYPSVRVGVIAMACHSLCDPPNAMNGQ